MRLASSVIFFCVFLSFFEKGVAQTTFWSEDFSSYADGVTTGANNNTDNPANDWTSGGCTTCPSSAEDYWEVRSNLFEARDVNNELVTLTTESIDISPYASVNFSVTVSEVGDLEGLYLNTDDCTDQSNEDFANVEYRIDGGAWQLVSNFLGWCGLYASCGTHTLYGDDGSGGDCRTTDVDWESSTVTVSSLTGSTLEIRLSGTNSSGTEFIQFDDILVEFNGFPLPVNLVSFAAQWNGNAVELGWETASETNNDFFTVERSADGYSYVPILEVDGAGNSQTSRTYRATDESPLAGTSYYRLKQTDLDGQHEYFQVKSVRNDALPEPSIKIYPNPAENQLHIEGDPDQLQTVELYRLSGQKVSFPKAAYSVENNTLSINIEHLPVGVYLLKSLNSFQRFVKH